MTNISNTQSSPVINQKLTWELVKADTGVSHIGRNSQGKKILSIYDANFDGKIDSQNEYDEKGNEIKVSNAEGPKTKLIDENADGIIDEIIYCNNP